MEVLKRIVGVLGQRLRLGYPPLISPGLSSRLSNPRSGSGKEAKIAAESTRTRSLTSSVSSTSGKQNGTRTSLSRLLSRKSVPKVVDLRPDWKRSSTLLNTRDELIISLLVDSREYDILTSEKALRLLQEHHSLVKMNSSNKSVSKQSEDQLEATNKRVDTAQAELLRVSHRANEVHRRLMEHRASVLSLSCCDSGYNSPIQNGTPSLSPSRSVMSAASTSTRFDGAHLFAGHVDAIIPKRARTPDAAASEITTLEEKLKAETEALTAAGKKQAELQRELSVLRLEKQEVETTMTLELQSAEETISALERELPKLENLEQQHLDYRNQWKEERIRLEERQKEEEIKQLVNALSEEKEKSRRELEEKKEETMQALAWSDEREQWERERAAAQDEKMEDLARLQEELERQKEEDLEILRAAGQELEDGLAAVDELMQAHEIAFFSRDSSLPGLVQAIGSHLQKPKKSGTLLRRRLENDVRSGLNKREALQMELEEARRARDTTALELNRRLTESPAQPPAPLPPVEINVPLDVNVAKVTSILLPLWNILPSPARGFRTGSPIGNVSSGAKSIADLDVRSLKTLYESARAGSSHAEGAGGPFTFEAFAARVQALIADDRSLIERLIRFAQVHDMLRQNADRAQRLALDGTNSLETYQKQVKTLEERNAALMTRMMQIQEEMQFPQDAADHLEEEKQEFEAYAAEQAETLRQLTDANNTLSAPGGPDKIRKQLEVQLAECRNQLLAAETEVNAMRMSEQSQRLALMNELKR
ncbi:hypothetical protein F5887DRAFT_1273072 [Amanita rubescens]|nr:hypothetical protein F5887DRAFT_1273072 [Amanita rubescens]